MATCETVGCQQRKVGWSSLVGVFFYQIATTIRYYLPLQPFCVTSVLPGHRE